MIAALNAALAFIPIQNVVACVSCKGIGYPGHWSPDKLVLRSLSNFLPVRQPCCAFQAIIYSAAVVFACGGVF